MAKGRKRKMVQREENGREQRSRMAERARTMATGIAQRTRYVAAVHAGDQRAGYAYGRAFLLGMISVTQFKAAAEFDAAEAVYRAVMGLPRRTPPAINLDGIMRGGARNIGDDEARAIRHRYDVRHRALMERGRWVRDMVYNIIVNDQPITDSNLFAFREALTVLGKLTPRGKGEVLSWRTNGAVPKFSHELWTACVEAARAA